MPMGGSGSSTKNYMTDGGNTLVIGGKLIIEEGAQVQGLIDNDTIYALPAATGSALGGVKVGSGLSIDNDGVLSADGVTPAAVVTALGNSAELSDVITAVNALITALQTAGLMATAGE